MRFRSARRAPAEPGPTSFVPTLCEPLEERLLFALAKAAGGSGYSANLSSNLAIRQQQLICDPDEPKQGSTSVLYDASKVTVAGLIPGPGYDNLGFIGLIEVRLANGNTILQPYSSFRVAPNGTETGYAQVVYKLTGTAGQLSPPTGFETIEHVGAYGVDTHAFFFSLRPGVDPKTEVRYKVYAEVGNAHSNNRPDGLTTLTGQELGPADLSPAVATSNFAPKIVSTGGPYAIAEGSPLTLTATATDVETAPADLIYRWDVNADGTVDAVGQTATLSPAALQALGLADGPKSAAVRLTVSDGSKSASADTTLAVSNVAPAVAVAVAPAANYWVGYPISLSTTFTDPALTDSHTIAWSVNGQPVAGAATAALSYTPTAPGTYTFTATVTDDDGGVGTASVAVNVTVEPDTVPRAAVLADPAYPGKLALFVWGTKYADAITMSKVGSNTGVTVGATSLGAFTGFGRLIVRGLAGNDTVTLNYTAASEVLFFGGDGNDRMVAGNFQSILVGGAGDDELSSGNAKDLLAGGAGKDKLFGGGGDDLLVGDRSIYDAGSDADSDRDVRAWSAIMREWVSGNTLAARQGHINGTLAGGLNGGFVLRSAANGLGAATVFSDAEVDLLDAGTGKDWLLSL
ncbi:MAG TPA: hypothetical protein VF796_13755 [Humisphaera sp.]